MSLELKTITSQTVQILEADEWTIEKLSTASTKELTGYSGIGRTTAQKIIDEAQEILNDQMLSESEILDHKTSLATLPVDEVIQALVAEGLTIQVLALSPVRSLDGHRGIDRALAAQVISRAQGMVNEQGLLESKGIIISNVPEKPSSPAFPEEWLSGAEIPPPMSVRVKRTFDKAKAIYEAENG